MEPDGRLRVDLEGNEQAKSLTIEDRTDFLLEGVSNDLQGVEIEGCGLTFKVEVRRASSRHVCRLGGWGEGQELRWLAAARCKLWWMTPSWGDAVDAVPPETQFLLVCTGADGAEAYVLFFPLVTARFRSSITGYRTNKQNSAIQLVVESADEGVVASSIDNVLLVVAGTNPFEVLHRGFRTASELPEAGFRLSAGKPKPKMLDRFGWCTWDAFMDKAWYQSRVTPEGIYEGLRQFAAGGIRVRHVILDDGWQSTGPDLQSFGGNDANTVGEEPQIQVQNDDLAENTRPPPSGASAAIYGFYRRWIEHAPSNSPMVMLWTVLCRCFNNKLRCTYANEGIDQAKRLRSVRANHLFEKDLPATPSDRKARSLRNMIATMKETHGVRSVFCWHHLLGYWCGLEPLSEEFASLAVVQQPFCPTPGVREVEPSQKWSFFATMGMGLPSGTSGASKLYTAMHSYLKASGVDGVKVDGQSAIGQCGQGLGGGPAMAKHFVTALENSVTQQFGSSECICCMSHSNENILNFKRSAVCRVSDDYLPDNAASQTSHIATCAFNSLFLGEVTIPDWDMFQSGKASAQLHAAARSVCGGPVYVSDPPQEHNFDLLRQLVTLDGTTLICDEYARPTRDCMFCNVQEDGKSALKLFNTNCQGQLGVVAAFNLQGALWDRSCRDFVIHESERHPIKATIRPRDVEIFASGYCDHQQYVMHQYSKPQGISLLSSANHELTVELPPGGFEIISFSPVVPLSEGGDIQVAPLGLREFMNPGGAVCGILNNQGGTGREIQIHGRGSGMFFGYASRAPLAGTLAGRGDSSLLPVAKSVKYDVETGIFQIAVPDRWAVVEWCLTLSW